MKKLCRHCEKEFWVYAYEFKRRKFCSMKCRKAGRYFTTYNRRYLKGDVRTEGRRSTNKLIRAEAIVENVLAIVNRDRS